MNADPGTTDGVTRPITQPPQNSYPRSSAFIRGKILLPSSPPARPYPPRAQASAQPDPLNPRPGHAHRQHRLASAHGQAKPPPEPVRPEKPPPPAPRHGNPRHPPTRICPPQPVRPEKPCIVPTTSPRAPRPPRWIFLPTHPRPNPSPPPQRLRPENRAPHTSAAHDAGSLPPASGAPRDLHDRANNQFLTAHPDFAIATYSQLADARCPSGALDEGEPRTHPCST